MSIDFAENIVQLLTGLTALLLCLIRYISQKGKEWLLAVCFFVFFMVGNYYWTAYVMIRGESPVNTDTLTYLGWNAAFFVLLLLSIRMKSPEERRYFHPLMLLPIPLNIWQLTLYLPYGGAVNNVYQVTVLTAVACLSIQSICWYRKKKEQGAPRPYYAVASLLFVCFEFGMWTSSCFDGFVADLYYLFSFLCSASFLLLTWALYRTLDSEPVREAETAEELQGRKKKKSRFNLLVPMIIIFFLMVMMVMYTSRTIQGVAVANVQEVGEDRITNVTAQLENYLEMTKGVLWVTADTVDFMSRNGATTEEMHRFLVEESGKQQKTFDENYSGLYGYVQGEYLDGMNWEPPEGYDPTQRDWYGAAIRGGGESTLVPPYLDADTGGMVISVARMLSNGTDVLSLDVSTNHILEIVENLQIKEKGFGFVVSEDGMLIVHQDESLTGRNLNEIDGRRELMSRIRTVQNGTFETEQDGEKYTAFVHQILGQWYAVILVSNTELYEEVWNQMAVNVLISVVIFAFISFFYLLGYKNEQIYSRRIEEMRAEEQRQAFEARALKLEKEAADQANQAKSDFLAEMSHEIRTPINAVLGMNEMIIREAQQAGGGKAEADADSMGRIHSFARNIKSAGGNLLSVINDILDFSKIEAGKMNLMEAPYSLSSLLNDVGGMFSFRTKEKGLSFSMEADETLPDGLYGDKVRVRQVISNLLSNAVKYTNQGGIRLEIRKEDGPEEENGQTVHLMIAVHDTGIGIRQEDIGKLFTKFQRLDMKTNSTVEGTGLGLAISHSLLGMMGGSIEVKSRYGEGSSFIVHLPQKIVSDEPLGNFRARTETETRENEVYRERFHAPDARILVVDDTRMNLAVATGLLKSTQVHTDTALGGREAVKKTGIQAYDLILLDQRMPDMDGTETLRTIREQPAGLNRETPVICLTADAVIGAKERYIAEGFTDYLSKPIDGKELEQMLIRYLPAKMVIPVAGENRENGEEDSGPAPVSGNRFDSLRTAGIDPETGLRYCRRDEALYGSLLEEYARGAEEKLRSMEQAKTEQDWQNYAIQAHALKSTSRTIGAEDLAGFAAEMEKAANDQNAAAVSEGHDRMAARVAEVISAIRENISSERETPKDEEGVLEFLPEE